MKKKKSQERTVPDTLMSLRIPRSLHTELQQIATEDERTIAATVRLAIREYIERREKQSQ